MQKAGDLANKQLADAYLRGEIPEGADLGELRSKFRQAIAKSMRDLNKKAEDALIESEVGEEDGNDEEAFAN